MARGKSNLSEIGDDEARVANVSGAPSPNTEMRPRDRELDPAPPSQPPGHRTAVQITADTGQLYDAGTRARARQVWADAVGKFGDPRSRTHLNNLLGLDDPGQ